MHWYNPKTRVAQTVSAPYTDQEAKYMLLGTPALWACMWRCTQDSGTMG